MLKKISLLFIIFLFLLSKSFAQSNFRIIGNKNEETIHFKLINNLIILPVELNGKKRNFLLDTGSKHTILFNIEILDSIKWLHAKKIKIRGVGRDKYYDALSSNNNLLRIKNIVSPNFRVLLILNENFDFSNRLGINIDGILGSDFFENFIVAINYNKKRIIVSRAKNYTYKKCRKCKTFPLEINNKKPYIKLGIKVNNKVVPIKLLIDSGLSDALWLHTTSSKEIKVPIKNIESFLGKGLNGAIIGKKAKLKTINIGLFNFNEVIASYPDSIAFGENLPNKRNGLLGAEILSRFSIIYNYPNKKIRFKKNRATYNKPFFYDKSGLDIIHEGEILVQKSEFDYAIEISDSMMSKNVNINSFFYSFENNYVIDHVKKGSIGYRVGLREDDILVKLNYKNSYDLTLLEINNILSGQDRNTIKLKVKRNGKLLKFQFKLEDLL